MSEVEGSTIRTMNGLDNARRVGWAKYFDTRKELVEMQQTAKSMLIQAVSFAQEIVHHERLTYDDPLVLLAQEFLRRVGSTPNGAKLVNRVKGFDPCKEE